MFLKMTFRVLQGNFLSCKIFKHEEDDFECKSIQRIAIGISFVRTKRKHSWKLKLKSCYRVSKIDSITCQGGLAQKIKINGPVFFLLVLQTIEMRCNSVFSFSSNIILNKILQIANGQLSF